MLYNMEYYTRACMDNMKLEGGIQDNKGYEQAGEREKEKTKGEQKDKH